MTNIKQHTFSKNPKQTSGYSKLTSYVESLKLFIISLLFSANAYAQTITPTAFIHLEYSYDGVGNVTEIIDHTDSQNTRSMQYDSLDRLAGATGVWGPGSFSYDPIGNRTKKSIGSSSNNYSYGTSDNRLSGYSHDASGNLLQDDSFIYEYDSENRLVKVRSGANVIAEYQYDGDGRRIKKVANGETTYYAYGTGLNVLTELNGQGVPKYDYIYAGNKNVARVNFDENGAVQNKSFYHTDHLGSSLAMTDETTTVIWNQNYLPFGEPQGGAGTVENSHQYTGKEFEEETGLYYYGARYYHSGLGRFTSVDPAPPDPTDPQSWNRYAYVLNNPYKYVDPDGENPLEAIKLTLDTVSFGAGQLSRFVEQDSFAFYFLQGFSKDTENVSDLLGFLTIKGIGKVALAKSVSVVNKGTVWKSVADSGERLVIGRLADLKKPRALQPGEYKLEWPPKWPNTKAEWKMNSSLLRQEMRMDRPIRDVSSTDDTKGIFLNAERNLLRSKGWYYDKNTKLWMPPGGK